MHLLPILTLLLVVAPITHGANVIMFLTLISKSMKHVFNPIAKEMVNRGHTVTMVTPFAAKEPSPGIKEIIIPDILKQVKGGYTIGNDPAALFSWTMMKKYRTAHEIACEIILANREIKEILEGKDKFDLVVLNILFEDCNLVVAEKLGLPFVYVNTYGLPVQKTNNLRIPSCMPYCSAIVSNDFTNKMTFIERLQNSFNTLKLTWIRERYFAPAVDAVIRKHLGDVPSVLDIERNVSLIIVNDHFSITYARPILPNIIHAGYMHCTPAKPLPKELQEWVEGSGEDGFIYFSLGTFIPSHTIPKKSIEAFVRVFSNIRQRVIWKSDLEEIPNLSKNVKLFKWLPQQDLLGHPKIRLFMTHGGMLSVQEAFYHGVPMLGFPAGIDQPYNMNVVRESGCGTVLNWKDITTESLQLAVNQMLNNPMYKKNAERKRSVSRDLQNSPLDSAVYWMEYVIRHNGAPQLRTGALALTWYQYYQVDILLLLLVLLLLLMLTLALILKTCRRVYKAGRRKTTFKTD